MKNLLLLASLLFYGTLFAQFDYSEDFESYSTGNYLGVESDFWTTWSGTLGGAEDVQITNDTANSGNNSTYYSSTSANGGPWRDVKNVPQKHQEDFCSCQLGSCQQIWAERIFIIPHDICSRLV